MISCSAHDDRHAHGHSHHGHGHSHAHGCSGHRAAAWNPGKGTPAHCNSNAACCPRRVNGRRSRFNDDSCPVCSVMTVLSAVLLISASPLASCAGHGAAPCSGHGVLHGNHCDCDPGFKRDASQLNCVASAPCSGHGVLHGNHCDCDPGFKRDASQLNCVASFSSEVAAMDPLHSSSESWISQLSTSGNTASQHIWSLLGAEDYQQPVGVEVVQNMMDMATGVYSPQEPECAGKGHFEGGACHCDKGYITDPSDGTNCVPSDGHEDPEEHHDEDDHEDHGHDEQHDEDHGEHDEQHDEDHDDHEGHNEEEHDQEEHGNEEHHEDDHEENDHEEHHGEEDHEEEQGHEEHDLEEHHDEDHGDEDHHEEDHNTTQMPSRRRLAQDLCGGHGHPHGGECHCEAGYITDPSDSANCIAESSGAESSGDAGTTGDVTYTLTADEIMAVAGNSSDGLLRFENLTAALPLIVSCQMDPLCSLETTPPPVVQLPEGPKDSEVELWMALVAAASLAVIPIVAMALPLVVFNSFSGRQMDVFVSLGNCLSAGLIFSLGIMHIIPDTIEDLYKTGASYPLNYLLIVVGFFVTLFLEVVVGGNSEDAVEETVACSRRSSLTDPTGGIGGTFSIGQSAKLQETSGSPQPDPKVDGWVGGGGTVEDGAPMLKAGDAAVADAPKGSRKPFGDVLKAILPVILFFVAIQFHACLECIVIGVQTSLDNFWTLFAGISVHKAFVSFAFGVKLHRSSRTSNGHNWYLITMAGLWALLPALCVILGYLLSDGMHPMAKLVFASLAGGTFLYIGSFEILGEEFENHHHRQVNGHDAKDSMPDAWGTKMSDRLIKFAAIGLGVTLVAALSAIPHKHD